MKKFLMFLLLAGLYACEDLTSIDSINPYSGKWIISFSDGNAVVREGTITILDNGSLCSRISALSNDSVYVAGQVNMQGNFTGYFADTCGGAVSGNITGNWTELLGIFYGQGNWTDTSGSIMRNGEWSARKQ